MQIQQAEQIPINVVGSSTFGVYPMTSLEKTYNMFQSDDDWMFNYAGFKYISDSQFGGKGRAIFRSVPGKFLVAVIGGAVYKITSSLAFQFVANLQTTTGFVSIDENLSNQICIVDGVKAYIYYYPTETFTTQSLSFTPNYVCYHNTFFLFGSSPNTTNPSKWYVYSGTAPSTLTLVTERALQTKPDVAWAVRRLPGRGNNVIVFGKSVAEIWTQTGGTQNYTRVSSFNIDNGCISVSTIAASEDFVVWLAQNENNSPVIMMTNGGEAAKLSKDGIDNVLQDLKHPEISVAFFYRQDGHLFYQITFYHPDDNLTLFYDFNTQKFYHASDEKLNYFPTRQVVYFNEKTYFVSINDNALYEMSTSYDSYQYLSVGNGQLITEDDLDDIITETGEDIITEDGVPNNGLRFEEIPRLRICKTIRKQDSSIFRVGFFAFWIEQGVNNFNRIDYHQNLITQDDAFDIITEDGDQIVSEESLSNQIQSGVPRVDMSFSKNGNQTFSNIVSRELNESGHYRNQIRWHRMGFCNEFTIQLRFWGFQRFVVNNGILEIY